jgi:hypothetical protein
MSIEFIARVTGVDDVDCLVAAVAERADGTGRQLIFQASHEPPDEDDVEDGMDTYCLVTEGQATVYGCVRELTIDGDRMHVVVDPDAVEDLGLEDSSITVQLAVDEQSVEALRDYLRRILAYGREDAHPAVVRL